MSPYHCILQLCNYDLYKRNGCIRFRTKASKLNETAIKLRKLNYESKNY